MKSWRWFLTSWSCKRCNAVLKRWTAARWLLRFRFAWSAWIGKIGSRGREAGSGCLGCRCKSSCCCTGAPDGSSGLLPWASQSEHLSTRSCRRLSSRGVWLRRLSRMSHTGSSEKWGRKCTSKSHPQFTGICWHPAHFSTRPAPRKSFYWQSHTAGRTKCPRSGKSARASCFRCRFSFLPSLFD